MTPTGGELLVRNDERMSTFIRYGMILGLLVLVSCATHQPHIVGQWRISGTDSVVMLSKDHSARWMSDRETNVGNWRMVAPDLLIITVPGKVTRTIVYNVPLDGHEGRSLKVFIDTESKTSPNAP